MALTVAHTSQPADTPGAITRTQWVENHTVSGTYEAFPVGAIFVSAVSTDPATLLGYGTWSAIGAGRVLIGQDTGDTDFDVLGETGGAKTVASSAQTFAGTSSTVVINHTHAVTVTDAGHSHLLQGFPTATGGSTGFTRDTSMSGTPANTASSTSTDVTGITATTANPAGGAASYTPEGTNTAGAATSVVQPYLVVKFWQRTA